MAAYASTVTLAAGFRKAEPFKGGHVGIIVADVNITNYNTTLAEITGLTAYFRNLTSICPCGPSDEGYTFSYDSTNQSLKAWTTQTSGVLVEASSDTDVGSVRVHAYGNM